MIELKLFDIKKLAPNGRADILAAVADGAPLMARHGIGTPLRVCHFLTQIAHESAGFRTAEEYASGSAYEGRKDLGNIQAGDGRRFKGRGVIQTTGRANYRAFTQWAKSHGYPSCPDFVERPKKLMEFPWALLSAIMYWDTHGLNLYADRDDIRTITRKINGGYNGLADRKRYLAKAKGIWGSAEPVPVPPVPEPTPAPAPIPARPATAKKPVPKGTVPAAGGLGTAIAAFFAGIPWDWIVAILVLGAVAYVAWRNRDKIKKLIGKDRS